MKKLSLLFTGLLGLTAATAQTTIEKRYDATYSTGATYEPLSAGATQIVFDDADWDDDISNPITLAFPFKYQNTIVNNIMIETYGSLLLNGLAEEEWGLGSITGLNMDYAAQGRGKVLYEMTGSAGSRIFKVEYRNVGRYLDDFNIDTLNFQIWLHESDNAIEYRAGYSNIHDTMFANTFAESYDGDKEALMAGLLSNQGDSISSYFGNLGFHSTKLSNGAFADTMLNYEQFLDEDEPTINTLLFGAYPPQGSIIRFVPKGGETSLGNIDFNLAKIFPNPSKDGKYTIELKEQIANAQLTVFDVTGKQVFQKKIAGDKMQLDLSNLVPGKYFGKIEGAHKTGVFKLIKG